MKDKKTEANESAESLADQIEIADVDSYEDIDREQFDAIKARVDEIKKIDFSEVIPPQRELLKLEIQTLNSILTAWEKSIEEGENDV